MKNRMIKYKLFYNEAHTFRLARHPNAYLLIQTFQTKSKRANENTKDATSPNQSVNPGEAVRKDSVLRMFCFGVHLVKDFVVFFIAYAPCPTVT
jgi:hypothetical protein